MNTIKILFTGVGRRVELIQAFRQAANKENIELKIYGADISSSAPALAFCDYIRITSHMMSEGYIDELIEICRRDQIDLVIPTIDTDLLVLILKVSIKRFNKSVSEKFRRARRRTQAYWRMSRTTTPLCGI